MRTLFSFSDRVRGSAINREFGSIESIESLCALEQRVEEACAMAERVPRERGERQEFGREIERKEREIRAERTRKKSEREARELQEASRWPQQQEPIPGPVCVSSRESEGVSCLHVRAMISLSFVKSKPWTEHPGH